MSVYEKQNETLIRLPLKAPSDAIMLIVATPLTLGSDHKDVLQLVWRFVFFLDVAATILMWAFYPSAVKRVEIDTSELALAVTASCLCVLKWIYIFVGIKEREKYQYLEELSVVNKERADLRVLLQGGHYKDAMQTILLKTRDLKEMVAVAYVKLTNHYSFCLKMTTNLYMFCQPDSKGEQWPVFLLALGSGNEKLCNALWTEVQSPELEHVRNRIMTFSHSVCGDANSLVKLLVSHLPMNMFVYRLCA